MSDAPAAPNPPDRHARLDPALGTAVLLAAVGFYLRFGYSFGAEDHDDLLPELLRRLDPALFARDPFVADRIAGVSVREAFVGLLQGLSHLMPVEAAVALLHVVTFVATAWGVNRLTRALLPDLPLAALLAPAGAMVVFVLWTLGQNTIAYPYLVPEGIAWALVLPAMVGVSQGRAVLPGVLVGVAGWFHGVTGLIVALALVLVIATEALTTSKERRLAAVMRALIFSGVFGLVAAPFVLRVMLGQIGEGAGGSPSGYDLFVRLRLPHHLLPTAFPIGSWARFGVLAVAGGLSLAWLHRQRRIRKFEFAARFLLVTAALCVLATIGVVVFESLAVARAQAFKLTVPAALLLVIGLCGAGAAVVERAGAGLHRVIEWPVRAPTVGLGIASLLAVVVLALAWGGIGRPAAMYAPASHARSDDGRVEQWARRRAPVDALFVVPPANTSFRVGAHRSTFVTWKAHPFRSDRMREWFDDLQIVAPAPVDPDAGGWSYRAAVDAAYCANGDRDWDRIARETGADFAVVSVGCGAPAAQPLFRAGALAVYRLGRR